MSEALQAGDATAAVDFEGVHVSFGPKHVHRGLDLSVRPGEILTLLGGSGSGKSVLLKLILGLIPWQQGRVVVDGTDLSEADEEGLFAVRRRVGMVFQGGALFDSLDVFENIVYSLRERGVTDPDYLRARVAEVLAMVDLSGIENMLPAELSGGMRKRVALARAVAEMPNILLYDEPTTGLDPMNVRRISELIVELRDRLSVTSIVVTHDLPSAFLVSDRIAVVAEGRIAAVDTVEGIQRSRNPHVRPFLDSMPLILPTIPPPPPDEAF